MILLTVPFLSFDFVLSSPSLRSIQMALIVILIPVVIVRAYKRNILFNRYFICLFLYLVSMTPFSLVEMNATFAGVLKFYGRRMGYFALCLVVAMYIKEDARRFIKCMTYLYVALITLNFITIVLWPEGLSQIVTYGRVTKFWLLGYDNGHALYQIYAIMLAMLYSYVQKGKILSGIVAYVYVISLFSSLALWTATSVIALLMIPITVAWKSEEMNRAFFNMRTYAVVIAGICLLLLFITFNKGTNPFILWLTTDVLKKDITFSNRTNIWLGYFNYMKSFLFGNGYETEEILESHRLINSAHNQWFQLFYHGGIVHLCFYLLLLREFIAEIMKNYAGSPQRVISSCIFSLMIVQLMRICLEDYSLTMFTLGYFCSYLVSDEERVMDILSYAANHNLWIAITERGKGANPPKYPDNESGARRRTWKENIRSISLR